MQNTCKAFWTFLLFLIVFLSKEHFDHGLVQPNFNIHNQVNQKVHTAFVLTRLIFLQKRVFRHHLFNNFCLYEAVLAW